MDQKRFARHLRRNMTDAERLLWRHLRARRLQGGKFRRQQPIGPYVVDFVHLGARLIVECDGGQHNERAADQRRDAWLSAQGFGVLRYWNHDILNETDAVLSDILAHLYPAPRGRHGGDEETATNTEDEPSPPGSPLPSRERG